MFWEAEDAAGMWEDDRSSVKRHTRMVVAVTEDRREFIML
jgi:hypothetical protein